MPSMCFDSVPLLLPSIMKKSMPLKENNNSLGTLNNSQRPLDQQISESEQSLPQITPVSHDHRLLTSSLPPPLRDCFWFYR